jgi:hypothetical protein
VQRRTPLERKEIEMASSESDKSQIRWARLAGFMYLFVDLAYTLGLLIANRLQVPGNFAETARRIVASETLYRIALSSQLIASICTVFLAFGLYAAVKPIGENLALLALLFRLVEATIFGLNVLFSFVVLESFIASDYLKAFSGNEPSVLLILRSAFYSDSFTIAGIFFSFGSILFFYLFLKSTYIPKVLSAFGLFSSALVTIVSFTELILPRYAAMLQVGWGWAPLALAEILAGLWLLIKGLNLRETTESAGIR